MDKEKIIEILKENSSLEKNCDFSEENTDFIDTYSLYNKYSIDYCNGASKFVLTIPGASYVIKIPFTGSYYEGYDEGYEDSEGYYHQYYTDTEFKYFEGADSENGWDYCAAEENFYSRAEENNLEEFFAKTERIGDVDGFPIYVQERADMDGSEYASSDDSRKKAQQKMTESSMRIGSLNWAAYFVEYYNEELFNDLLIFLKEEGINDLHGGNVGYINNRPVLVDYSGFNS